MTTLDDNSTFKKNSLLIDENMGSSVEISTNISPNRYIKGNAVSWIFNQNYGATEFKKIQRLNSADKISVLLKNSGQYKNAPIDTRIEFSNFKIHDPNGTSFLTISHNLYSGFVYQNIEKANVDYTFYQSGTNNPIKVDDSTYLTVNSLNGVDDSNPSQSYASIGEFTAYKNGGEAYVSQQTNIEEINFNGDTVYTGKRNSKFDDFLGGKTFYKNSVMFQGKGETQHFTFGAGYGSAWATLSSALIGIALPDNPVKSVTTPSGTDINTQEVEVGESIVYHIKQNVPTLKDSIRVDDSPIVITDSIPKNVTVKKAYFKEGWQGSVKITGNNITGTIDVATTRSKKASEVELIVEGTISLPTDKNKKDLTFSNQATSSYKNKKLVSNTVKNELKAYVVDVLHYDNEDNKSLKEEQLGLYGGENYQISPKTDLKKKTKKGTYDYISFDDKSYTGKIEKGSAKTRTFRLPYICPRILVEPQKLVIDTEKSTLTLPSQLNIVKEEQLFKNRDTDFKDIVVRVDITDSDTKKVLWSETKNYYDLKKEQKIKLDTKTYKKKTKIPVDVTITFLENPNNREVLTNEEEFISVAYTASEEEINNNKIKDGKIEYTYPIQTIKEKNKELQTKYETLILNFKEMIRSKTGYGVKEDLEIDYTNERKQTFDFSVNMEFSKSLQEKDNLIDYPEASKTTDRLDLSVSKKETETEIAKVSEMTYNYPSVLVEEKTGTILENSPNGKSKAKNAVINGGNKFYIPIWHDLGDYDLTYHFKEKTIGNNYISLNLTKNLNLYAYMYAHKDSGTTKLDELLLKPIFR